MLNEKNLNFAGQAIKLGAIANYSFMGIFWKAVPKENWTTDESYLASIEKQCLEPSGDMCQGLVFIEQGLNQDRVTQVLDDCVLSEEEVLRGKDYRATRNVPFPTWEQNA